MCFLNPLEYAEWAYLQKNNSKHIVREFDKISWGKIKLLEDIAYFDMFDL